MDRNDTMQIVIVIVYVALRKESVDRNPIRHLAARVKVVALRKESVDRNMYSTSFILCATLSLSARRAWIEIGDFVPCGTVGKSLSARRAWIEIIV